MTNNDDGVRWLAWLIAGPTVWAATFTAAYGLIGLGCQLGWSAVDLGPLSVQTALVLAIWLAGIVTCIALLGQVHRSLREQAAIPRIGVWIGLVATVFTLAPVLVATSCY
ncbi:hypothetical protein [Xanthobacter wiegelii]|uniref:hypothetical protein n=1 Tax=Xanthobacter wiegelii TaxID=3119913 RepID=UPI00372BE245